ncbi:citrate lyase subunit alpha [Bradyrhizobium sp. PRIMUS42]|uniref:citrate lyase subunit alpha n=1 Tax=Bradyrhizobium sp. PRIMUS42 TaxID=2908926 RepID=UPI001FF67B2A|nr:citrate lyase subunit alpha [Bradyrhizobium sp. PRIMUS42]MCJ9728697.1 hypothetical protein [Bradyrhizobium sp. PRIMUS42]
MNFDYGEASAALASTLGGAGCNGSVTRDVGGGRKIIGSLEAAIRASNLRDGSTISFHHHYRNGDHVMNRVLAEIDRLGLRDIRVAASSIFPNNTMMTDLMERGVIRGIVTDYIAGPVAEAVMRGKLTSPLILQSHGGRARAILSGQLQIDAAFIGASLATTEGAATGRFGPCPCGPLGYAMVDAQAARKVVVVAAATCEPCPMPFEIAAHQVDHVVEVPLVGDVAGIASGSTRPAATPESVKVSSNVAAIVAASGLLTDGFSFQTGAGGFSLAAASAVATELLARKSRGAFISGGITGEHVRLLRAGAVDYIYDVQSFDAAAIASSNSDWNHVPMSADNYANPNNPNALVNRLSVMLMGAIEIDRDFDVNVALAGDGRVLGGPGGHPDTAEGCQLAIVTTALTGGGFAKVVDKVGCSVTRGRHIDAIATDVGVCINPRRCDLIAALQTAKVPILDFEELQAKASVKASQSRQATAGRQLRVIVEDRHGGPCDVILG